MYHNYVKVRLTARYCPFIELGSMLQMDCNKLHILRKAVEGYGFCFDFIPKDIIFSTQITVQGFHKIFALPGSASRRLAEMMEPP